jgi:hypothetical protein
MRKIKKIKKVWKKPGYYEWLNTDVEKKDKEEIAISERDIINGMLTPFVNILLGAFFMIFSIFLFICWLIFVWDNYYIEVKK